MDFRESAEDVAFRAEVREFVANAPAGRHPRSRARLPPRAARGLRALAENPARAGLGRAGLAEAIRRHGVECAPAHDLRGGMFRGRRAAADAVRPVDGRPGADEVRHAGAAGEVPAAHRLDGRLVVPGLLGAGRRFRPRVAQDARRAARRRLRRERPEDVDQLCPLREHVLLPGAHARRTASRSRASRSC